MADRTLYQEAFQQTQRNTEDIHNLSVNVARLAATFEASEKRRDEDMHLFREAASRMTELVGLEKDIAVLASSMNEQKTDMRLLRHDLNSISNAMSGLSLLGEKINETNKNVATLTAKVELLESFRDKFEGGRAVAGWAVRAFWAIFGTGIMAGLYFIVQLFVTKGGGSVGGE